MYEYGWPAFWAVFAIVFFSFVGYCVHNARLTGLDERQQIGKLIADGKSPVAARCAVMGSEGSDKQALICQAAVLMERN